MACQSALWIALIETEVCNKFKITERAQEAIIPDKHKFGFSCLKSCGPQPTSQPLLPITPMTSFSMTAYRKGELCFGMFSGFSGWKIRNGDCEIFLQNSRNH